MRKLIRLSFAVIISLCLLACGSKTGPADAVSVGKSVMQEASGFPEMKTLTSDDKDADIDFTTLCDYDYDGVSSFYYAYAADGTAPEMAVISLKNADDTAELMRSIKDHVKTREGTMQEYTPDQVQMVQNYILVQQKGTVGLFIGQGATALEKSFKKVVK